MTCIVSHTTVDSRNAYELSEWWKQLLGYTDIPGDPNLPEHPECMIQSPDGGHQILFIADDHPPKTVKNRLHFDLRPEERDRADEVEWALSIGATLVDDQSDHYGPGVGWTVLADPEGNEFCILRSIAEYERTKQVSG